MIVIFQGKLLFEFGVRWKFNNYSRYITMGEMVRVMGKAG